MPISKKRDSEPIPGYRLIEPLGNGGFGEVWKCEAPGGIQKAIKFVYGDLNGLAADSIRAEEELLAVQRIKSIRHPFLLSMDRVENVDGELIIITELADQNLDEFLSYYRGKGSVGIPRTELLNYLREAAEVLDLMNLKFDLQHLDVKPRNLFLVSNHVKVADFGLVNSLAGGREGGAKSNETKVHLGAITPLYAAPEVFLGKLSRHCDQYSLAIVFQELLTGVLPFSGQNSRQLLLQHTKAEPNLSPLPPNDRPIVARALAKNPDHRFPSCMDFLRALSGEGTLTTSPGRSENSRVSEALHPVAETISNHSSDTEQRRSRNVPTPPPGVLDRHVFLHFLGNSPLSDYWMVQTPDGGKRMAKFLYGFPGADLNLLKEARARLQALQHPALAPAEVVHVEPGRVIIVTDLPGQTLSDRFQQCHAAKLIGIPRSELVDYIRAAAEVLDYLYQQHGIQHLAINPRNLMLEKGWLQIAEFGLAQILWLPVGQKIAESNSRYAPPEYFDGIVHRSNDQFALALLFAEMLTGVHPYSSKSRGPRSRRNPDLGNLSERDREVIGRAIDRNPAKRWQTCTDMVMALEGDLPQIEKKSEVRPDPFTQLIHAPRTAPIGSIQGATSGDIKRMLAEIIQGTGGKVVAESLDEIPELSFTGDQVKHKFRAGLPLGAARQKLESFHKVWGGRRIRDDHDGLLIHVDLPTSLWRRLFGQRSVLEIIIRLRRVQLRSATPIEILTEIKTHRSAPQQARKILEDMSPLILDSLRNLLLVASDKRTQERLAWPHSVRVIPIVRGSEREEPVECRGKDISQAGLGFYLPHEIQSAEVLIELINPFHPPSISIPATLVRAKRCADGWYDVGALFRLPVLRKSAADIQLVH